MKYLPRIEQILLAVGTFILLTSLYFFFFESDRLSRWFGYNDETKRTEIGKVMLVKDQGRRKLPGGSEFSPLFENQIVFSRDLLMTGAESGLVFQLNDGSTIELGPDTLIEIKFKDDARSFDGAEFLLDLKRGLATGKSAGKNLIFTRNGVRADLAQPKADGLSAYLLSRDLQDATGDCEISGFEIVSPYFSKEQLPQIRAGISCKDEARAASFSVKNAVGEVIAQNQIEIGPDLRGQFEFNVDQPGDYSVTLNNRSQTSKSLKVPRDFTDLTTGDQILRCDRGVSVESLAVEAKALALINLSDGKIVREEPWKGKAYFSELEGVLPLPATVRFELQLKSAFILTSKPLSLVEWRQCPKLENPKDQSKVKFIYGKGTLFTWREVLRHEEYLFEISDVPTFKTTLVSQKVKQNFVKLKMKREGLYYWRITALKKKEVSDTFQLRLE